MKLVLKKSVHYLQSNLRIRRRPLAYVGGWIGKNNLGDEALYSATKKLFNRSALWHFDGSRTMSTLLKRIPLTKHGVFAGGTLINRCPEYLQIAERFLRAKRQLYVFGTGVADPDFWQGRGDFRNMLREWKRLLGECQYVGVRGPRSAELLADAGLSNVEVVGDPVIVYAEDTCGSKFIPDSIGLNIGYDHGNQWGDKNRFAGQVLRFSKMARRARWAVKWFVVFPKDLEITKALAAETGTADNICCIYDNPRRFMQEVRSMSTFVGMKLHATMLATCAHVPSLMLEYDPKCRDFMKSIGQDGSTFRTDRFVADDAWELVKSWNATREKVSRRSFEKVMSLKRIQLRKARFLRKKMFRAKTSRLSE